MMKNISLTINGMTCGHCVMSVKKGLGKIPGVEVEKVDIGTAELIIDERTVSNEMLAGAVEEAGYTITAIG